MATQAQRRATAKYNLANYDRINLRLSKNEKEELRKFINDIETLSEYEISTNGFLEYLVKEAMSKSPTEFSKKINPLVRKMKKVKV